MKNNGNLGFWTLLTAAVLIPTALMAYKLFFLDYPISSLIPVVSYRVDISMQVDGHGEDIGISTYLPATADRQFVREEQNTSGPFILTLYNDGPNRVARWKADRVSGRHNLIYTFHAQSGNIRYEIPEDMPIPESYPEILSPYLGATSGIQVHDPLISRKIQEILPDKNAGILESLRAIHRYLQDQLANKDFSGYTDAVTALKLEEASCNGKSRLFIALARKLNLPARLAGGLILEQGSKRVTHQWVEVYINGHWVPFDTINDHFAEIPSNYLKFYTGDRVMFNHTANVNFQYTYKMTRRLVPRAETASRDGGMALNTANLYVLFEKIGISQNLLKIILMLPFGALVTALLRNVVGLETFGTFLPALIAAAARETGFWWGTFGFITIILAVAFVGAGLERMKLLHTPKLAIMMTTVILVMLAMAALSVEMGFFELAHLSLFPIAILTITAERFVVIQTEQGFTRALKILLATIVAVSLCYAVMSSTFLQSLVLVFPEFLLTVIAMNLLLGKWIGVRVLEFVRFRRLMREAPTS